MHPRHGRRSPLLEERLRRIILKPPLKAWIGQKAVTTRIGDFGEDLFSALIKLKLGWLSTTDKDLDNAGIDREFRLEGASIDTQIRTARLGGRDCWAFKIFKAGEKLDKRLYSQAKFFLVLVGLHCRKQEFLEHPNPLSIPLTILMIDGKSVIRRLEPLSPNTHNITIYRKKYLRDGYKWLWGKDEPFKIFAEEFKRQTGKEMPLDEMMK